MTTTFRLALCVAVASLLPAFAGDTAETPKKMFAPPVQITAGGALITDKIYPTPVLQDLDGDGKPELVVGDLFGKIYSAKPANAGKRGDLAWTKLAMLQAEGKPLKLRNW